jgi:predicted nucleotidyltransferase
MRIVGLIAEYNPFHKGHTYHIQKAKELSGADHVIVVMSGDFVQRGAPALLPKHLRAEMALSCGADAVFELPVSYATGSAELFATGAVSLLDQLGVTDALCFGAECDALSTLEPVAQTLAAEPQDYRLSLRRALKSGVPFPLARQRALEEHFKLAGSEAADFSSMLSLPNNILAIEYLKALYRLDSSIEPFVLKRKDSDYHQETLQRGFNSASAIRKVFSDSTDIRQIRDLLADPLPAPCLSIIEREYGKRLPVMANDFSLLTKHALLCHSARELEQYQDLSPELSNRIARHLGSWTNFEEFCELIKTRDLTYTRVSRALIHILLEIKKDDIHSYIRQGYHEYARLLGFRKESHSILSEIHKKSSLKLVTKSADHFALSSFGRKMLKKDVSAADLYESLLTDRYHTPFSFDFQKPIVKI